MRPGLFRRICYLFVLLSLCLVCGCNQEKPTSQENEQSEETPEVVGTPEAEETPEANEVSQEEEPYVTAVPGVPEDLKDSKYDLETILTVPSLKDSFHKYFTMGVAINGNAPENAMVESPELRAITKYHFNSVTYSNLMKSSSLLDHSGCMKNAKEGDPTAVAVKFDACIPGLEFAKENGIGMRGHVLVWHNQVPTWFFREDYDDAKDFVDKDTMLARMESYIKQVLEFTQTEYPGVIYAWDVVNEAVSLESGEYDKDTGWNTRTHFDGMDNLWYLVIGADYVEKAYEYARKYADPEIKLFYNDYNTFDIGKTVSIYKLVEMLKEKDLIDGIGMQSAYNLNYPSDMKVGASSVKEALQRFSELGVEIHMSEVTIRIDGKDEYERQAKRYKEFFEVVLEMDSDNGGPCNITNVTFFGIMGNYLFYNGHKEDHWLIDKKLQPKPAFYSALEALQEMGR